MRRLMLVVALVALTAACAWAQFAPGWTVEVLEPTGGGAGYHPDVWNGRAVWEADNDIYYHDGTTAERIWEGASGYMRPHIGGGSVVWSDYDPVEGDREIYRWDGSTVTNLTDNGYSDGDATVDDSGNIVWERYDSSHEIVHWHATTGNETVVAGSAGYGLPRTDDGVVVWGQYDPNDPAGPPDSIVIHRWEGGTHTTVTSVDDYHDWNPDVHGDSIVWQSHSTLSDSSDIYILDGTGPPVNISDKAGGDYYPRIHDGWVVWHGPDATSSDTEIFLWDGATVIQLTDNDYNDMYPAINNQQIVWQGNSGVFLASYGAGTPGSDDTPEPATWLLLACTGGIGAFARRRKRG